MSTLNQSIQTEKSFLILVNFKNFEQTTGRKGLELAKKMHEFAVESRIETGVCVQPFLFGQLAEAEFLKGEGAGRSLKVLAQHVDVETYGSSTGAVILEAVKQLDGFGSLINHSEKRVPLEIIEKVVMRSKEVGVKIVVCVENLKEAIKVAEFNPDYIAIEPPELIGGDISVSTANPKLISDTVNALPGHKILVGAGIKNGQDVKIAKELGAQGILVASGVCKAENPIEVMLDFAKYL